MARQLDRLVKIGHEGFALIEECYGRTTSNGRSGTAGRVQSNQGHQNHYYHHHHHQQQQQQQQQQPFVYYGPQVSTVKMQVAISNETAHYYGGRAEEPVITSDEAAEYYGGLVIMDYGLRNNHFRRT